MKLKSLQTIEPVLLRNMDRGRTFTAGDELELEPVIDGARRDVIIRRPGEDDFLVWSENIAGATIESGEHEVIAPVLCGHCDRKFKNERALGAHIQRSHKAA